MGILFALLIGVIIGVANGGGIVLFVLLFLLYFNFSLPSSLFHTAVIIFIFSTFIFLKYSGYVKFIFPKIFYLTLPICCGFVFSKFILTILLPQFVHLKLYFVPAEIIYYLVITAILIYSGINFIDKTSSKRLIKNRSENSLLFIEGVIPVGGLVFCLRTVKVAQMEKALGLAYIFTLLFIKSVITISADFLLLRSINWLWISGLSLSSIVGFLIAQKNIDFVSSVKIKAGLGLLLLFFALLLLTRLFV